MWFFFYFRIYFALIVVSVCEAHFKVLSAAELIDTMTTIPARNGVNAKQSLTHSQSLNSIEHLLLETITAKCNLDVTTKSHALTLQTFLNSNSNSNSLYSIAIVLIWSHISFEGETISLPIGPCIAHQIWNLIENYLDSHGWSWMKLNAWHYDGGTEVDIDKFKRIFFVCVCAGSMI